MNCNDVQKGLLRGDPESTGVAGHLRECDRCKALSANENRLAGLLAGPPAVKAPADFNVRLLERIEDGKRGETAPATSWLRPVLLPAAALAALVVLVWFGIGYFAGEEGPEEETLAVKNTSEKGRSDQTGGRKSNQATATTAPSPAADPENAGREDQRLAKSDNGRKTVRKRSENGQSSGKIMTRDLATETTETVNPPGIDPSKRIETPDRPPAGRSFTAGEVLAELGILTERSQEGLKVLDVRSGSVGEATGVLAGDRVVAIDGRRLAPDEKFTGSISGKQLRIRRNGKTLDLPIRNRR